MAPDKTEKRKRQFTGKALTSALLTDVGRVREKNEDNALIVESFDLYVVADGMGGHSSGEVASQISVESIQSSFETSERTKELRKSFQASRGRDSEGARRRSFDEYRLWSALQLANHDIYDTARREVQYRDMGTTIVAIQFVGSRVYVAYVGDSRVYRIRGTKIEQLTEDHSLANEYIKMKILRKEDLPRFPYKNVIVRALGLSEHVKVDSFYRQVKPGDIYLLCSDGLSDLVPDSDIRDMIMDAASLESACRALVDEANRRGGVDNTTVLVVQVEE